jgi:hypothetical protein
VSSVAIEFCDPGIAIVRAREAPLESPGIALLGDGEALTVGAAAASRARLSPRSVQNRFWDRLGLERLPAPVGGVETVADLAAAHLEDLWRQADRGASRPDDAILVVPGGLDREQLGVLLGVVRSCSIPAIGMVDAAVAACATLAEAPRPDADTIHLDVLLHRSVLTELVLADECWERSAVRSHRQLGIASLHDLWAKFVAELFVRSTRFDPLHRAESEQALYDLLPRALASLSEQSRVPVEMEAAGSSYQVMLEREQLRRIAAAQYERLVLAIESARRPERRLVLLLSARAAALPGLVESVSEMPLCEVVALPAGAAGFGALAREAEICPPSGGLSLVTELRHLGGARRSGGASPAVPEGDPCPSHALLADRAHAIDGGALAFEADPANPRALRRMRASGDLPELGLVLTSQGGEVEASACGELPLFVNGRPAPGPLPVHLGDVLQLGPDGELLRLIVVAQSDGA